MLVPGIYLANASGEMYPLATEDGSGDPKPLSEAVTESLSKASRWTLVASLTEADR